MTDETAESTETVEEAPKRRGRPPKAKEAPPPRQLAEHRARLEEADRIRNA